MYRWLVLGLIVSLALFFAVGCGEEKPEPKKETTEVKKAEEPTTDTTKAEPKAEPKEEPKPEPEKIGDFAAKDAPEDLAKTLKEAVVKGSDDLQKAFADLNAKAKKPMEPAKVMVTFTVDKAGKIKVSKIDNKGVEGALKKVIEGWKDFPKATDKPIEVTFSIELGKKADGGDVPKLDTPKDEPKPDTKGGEPKGAPKPDKKVPPKKGDR
jgi:hypothetical protein